MTQIPLTQGFHAKVDDDFLPQIEGMKFHVSYAKKLKYAKHHTGVYLHRLVIGKPPSKSHMVTFKDGDGLNCQRENLEFKEHSKNTQEHSKYPRKKTSEYLGVSLRPARWRAYLKHDGVVELVGEFKTEIEAAAAYNKRAIEVFGETAKINIL